MIKNTSHNFNQIVKDVVEQAADGVMITDAFGNIQFANKALEKISGYRSNELLGRSPKIFQSGKHPQDFYNRMWEQLEGGSPFRAVFLDRNKRGGLFYVDQTITPVTDKAGKIKHFISIWKDVTRQKKNEAVMIYKAYHDYVTGLPNRMLLKDRMDTAISWASREGHRFGLLYIDLDKFKSVNDEFGHRFGDLVLYEVSQRLLHLVRQTDTVSRLGGDEFVILLNRIESDVDATKIGALVLKQVRKRFKLEGKALKISASIGIAVFPEHGLSAESLIKSADTALYQAKHSGRNNYQLYIK